MSIDKMEMKMVIPLKSLSKDQGFKGYSKLRKAELVKLLQANTYTSTAVY